jgi:hypothetical protein
VPKEVSEVSSGGQFSRSSNEGQLADSQTRSYKIIKSSVDEVVNIQEACQVRIGDQHPFNTNLYCVSFDARFEGDSRLAIAVTFNYQSTPSAGASGGGGDPRSQPPDVRPANWTTSTSLMEVPVSVWSKRNAVNGGWEAPEPAVNPVGDIYDGVTALAPVVTISITQFNVSDPTINLQYAGYVNAEDINLGNLRMIPGTVLFRGVSYQPTIESWGAGGLYKGWSATYEFAYRRNTTKVTIAGAALEADIGWDVAIPVTGFNVRAFAPNAVAADEDVHGQPLRHNRGKIVPPLLLPDGVDAGDRVRAMVKVFEYEEGGTSQLPSASPVALKLNGRPLKTHDANGNLVNPPIVFAYQTQPRIDLTKTLGVRLL